MFHATKALLCKEWNQLHNVWSKHIHTLQTCPNFCGPRCQLIQPRWLFFTNLSSTLHHSQHLLCPVCQLLPANKWRGNHGEEPSVFECSATLLSSRNKHTYKNITKNNSSINWSTPSVACSTSGAPRFPGRNQVETLGSPIVLHMRESPQGFSWARYARGIAASTRIEEVTCNKTKQKTLSPLVANNYVLVHVLTFGSWTNSR